MKFNDFVSDSTPTLMTMEEFHDRLSLESNFSSNVVDFFKTGMPSIVDHLKGYVTAFVQKDETIELNLDFYATQIDKNKLVDVYLTYRDVLVQIPEGFVGNFLDYVNALNKIGANLFTELNKHINLYHFTIGSILSNKDQQTSLKDLTQQFRETAAARKQLVSELSEYFNNTTNTRAKLLSVLPHLKDKELLLTSTKQLEKVVDYKQLMKIKELVKQTVDILDLMNAQLKNNEIDNISPQAVNNIARGAEELARFIDQTVVFYYASISIITCVNNLFVKLASLK